MLLFTAMLRVSCNQACCPLSAICMARHKNYPRKKSAIYFSIAELQNRGGKEMKFKRDIGLGHSVSRAIIGGCDARPRSDVSILTIKSASGGSGMNQKQHGGIKGHFWVSGRVSRVILPATPQSARVTGAHRIPSSPPAHIHHAVRRTTASASAALAAISATPRTHESQHLLALISTPNLQTKIYSPSC